MGGRPRDRGKNPTMARKAKPADMKKSAGLHIRLTEGQMADARKAAATARKELSEWARDILVAVFNAKPPK